MMTLAAAMIFAILILCSKNPMKTSILLLALSALIFLSFYMSIGVSWFSLIFMMLFSGGILMMMMILSSILPNEPNGYTYLVSSLSIISVFATMLVTPEAHQSILLHQGFLKWALQAKAFFIVFLAVMMTYFFTFIYILSDSKTSMRSVV